MVEALRRLNHDVLTIYEDGRANQRYPDESILETATQYGRAVLTTNRKHFIRLHLTATNHCGMIVCTFDPNFESQAQRINEAIQSFESLAGQLIRINRPV